MHLIPSILITLISALIVIGCSSAPEIKVQTQTTEPSKGQMITRCLDDDSPEPCDKKYNP